MKKIIFLSIIMLCSLAGVAQVNVQAEVELQKAFNKKVNNLLSLKVPFVSVSELEKNFDDYIILDSREEEEYEVGHIKGARCVGYDEFTLESVKDLDKNAKIAVYCSIGYRSEKITKKLRKAGYKNAFNVYGSIFQWVNEDKPIYNKEGTQVQEIHTYNRKWSKWVWSDQIKKTW